VVAGEVRNLAGRASEAAKSISELIRTSTERVEEGARMATLSGETLREVMDAFTRVSSAIAEVSSATQEQASSIQLVTRTVTDLESMTQQNASAVEESSAAAESVADQSRSVRELLSFFRTG
jgi:methyl-accepting chemotaxis protein